MEMAAIILAAGSSSRMGRSKQLLEIAGEGLLTRAIQSVLNSAISRVVVVLGYDEQTHRDAIKNTPVDIVHNPHWEQGMGSSIKKGLQHLGSKYPSTEAVLIAVCDQPLLSPEIILSLIANHHETGKPIIASGYSEAIGVPALFDKRYFNALETLPDDQGAKNIMIQNPSDVSVVSFPGGDIDLDTMEDYHTFLGQ